MHGRWFDPKARRCRCYERRSGLVPGCVTLTPQTVGDLGFMPETCAYRRIAEGKGLAWWHPLVSRDPGTVVAAGVAVSSDLVDEREVKERDLWRYLTNERRRSRDRGA